MHSMYCENTMYGFPFCNGNAHPNIYKIEMYFHCFKTNGSAFEWRIILLKIKLQAGSMPNRKMCAFNNAPICALAILTPHSSLSNASFFRNLWKYNFILSFISLHPLSLLLPDHFPFFFFSFSFSLQLYRYFLTLSPHICFYRQLISSVPHCNTLRNVIFCLIILILKTWNIRMS